MKKLNQLDKNGFYVVDFILGEGCSGTENPDYWTCDLVGDGYYKAKYQNADLNSDTGEFTNGTWVETDAPVINWVEVNTPIAERLKSDAMNSVSIITAKLAIGRTLTTAEKAKMNAVLDYCDAVDEVGLSVPDPAWPELPNT